MTSRPVASLPSTSMYCYSLRKITQDEPDRIELSPNNSRDCANDVFDHHDHHHHADFDHDHHSTADNQGLL